ncbi:MAG: hypothetical protein ACI4WW_00505 [Candidatus Coprovivens sp.]
MTDKEVSFRSIIFLVIGILLLLSLVICIYIVNDDRDLVMVSATVVDVKKDSEGTGKNDVTVSYMVDNTFYNYNFYYKDDVNVGDSIDIYYHSKSVTSVKTFKVSKLIFVCPIIGLALCVYGLFELFRRPKEKYDEDDFKTKIVSVVGNTEQLKILTDETQELPYVPTPEEVVETEVKPINKDDVIVKDDVIEFEKSRKNDEAKIKVIEDTAEKIDIDPSPIINEVKINDDLKKKTLTKNDKVSSSKELKNEINKKELKEEPKIDEIKKAVKKADPIKVIPKKYYISGTTLVCELLGNDAKEINFNDIVSVIKTINSEGKLVKLTVISNEYKCLLTNMYKINLVEIANTIHNKMLTINPDFIEIIENKEY